MQWRDGDGLIAGTIIRTWLSSLKYRVLFICMFNDIDLDLAKLTVKLTSKIRFTYMLEKLKS